MVLTYAQKEQFEHEGYLVVENFLDPVTELQPVIDEFEVVLDNLARKLVAEGKIKSTHAGLPFNDRLIAICCESGDTYIQHFDCSLPHKGITHETPVHTGPAMFRLLTNPRMLDLVEELIGPEIWSNPVQHVRMKLPRRAIPQGQNSYLTTRVPWHQDNGVIMPDADEATILTVWFPLTDATIENGCMQVVPRSHRQGITQHCPTSMGIAIPDTLVAEQEAEPVPLPMSAGSLLLMTQRTIHSSLDNVSDDDMRISMDLRYQPIGQSSGRPAFAPAGFVARSAAHPESVVTDPKEWTRRWEAVRETLIGEDRTFYRWPGGVPGCA
jgi:ectoine hydroxylase-related dioxygenase (phytanoyl-CoA dioxygenase family)